jgi:hypothetical protein
MLILRTINRHNRALVAIVERTLTDETRALLDALLIQDTANETIAPGKTSAYKLTLMKKLSQSQQVAQGADHLRRHGVGENLGSDCHPD